MTCFNKSTNIPLVQDQESDTDSWDTDSWDTDGREYSDGDFLSDVEENQSDKSLINEAHAMVLRAALSIYQTIEDQETATIINRVQVGEYEKTVHRIQVEEYEETAGRVQVEEYEEEFSWVNEMFPEKKDSKVYGWNRDVVKGNGLPCSHYHCRFTSNQTGVASCIADCI
jgi:hypothetical protein